jgi:hypothetical protein
MKIEQKANNLVILHRDGVRWCSGRKVSMASNMKRFGKKSSAGSPRASVTFPPDLYQALEALAKKNKVSVAWVVREAAERYVADQWPLFGKKSA